MFKLVSRCSINAELNNVLQNLTMPFGKKTTEIKEKKINS